MTPQAESMWIFIGAGVFVLAFFFLIVLSAHHAREVDIRCGLRRRESKK